MNSPAPANLTAADCLPHLFHEQTKVLRQLGELLQQLVHATLAYPERSAALDSMRVLLAQVEAAFTMAGADPLVAIAALAHRIVTKQSENSASFPVELADTLRQTFGSLTEAMAQLLVHERLPIPKVFACWAALAAWDRSGHAHPSLMLSLDVDYRMLPPLAVTEESALLADPRGEFERALLRFLRSDLPAEVLNAAQRIKQVIAALAVSAQPESETARWRVLHAATGLIAEEKTSDIALAKKILAATGRVIRQIGSTVLASIPPSLVREALFLIATANEHTSESADIVHAFDLDAQLPSMQIAETKSVMRDTLAIAAVVDEIQSLIVLLDAPGAVALLTPAQLDNLIRCTSLVPELACVASALSRLQTRLSANDVHPDQMLAIAACLLSLQALTDLMTRMESSQAIAQRIATTLDAIGDTAGIPGWHSFQTIGIVLQIPSALASLTDAVIDSLAVVERQIERLIDETHTVAEQEAGLAAMDHRLAEIQAALILLDEQTLRISLGEIREQLASVCVDNENEHNSHRREIFAEKFVRLSAVLAAIPRSRNIVDGDSFDGEFARSDRWPENQSTRSTFDTRNSLHVIFLDEAKARLQQLGDWLHAAPIDRDIDAASATHAAHALAGCSATVGLAEMRQLALAMESVLTAIGTGGRHPTAHVQAMLQHGFAALENMLADLSSGFMPQAQPAVLEQLLALSLTASEFADNHDQEADSASLRVSPTASTVQTTARPASLPGDHHRSTASKHSEDAKLPAGSRHAVFAPSASTVHDSMHDELHEIFIEEAADLMPQLDQQLRIWLSDSSGPEAPAQMLRILHTLKGSARMAGEIGLGDALHQMEQTVAELSRQSPPDAASLHALETTLDQLLQPFVPAISQPLSAMGDGPMAGTVPAHRHIDQPAAAPSSRDMTTKAVPEKTQQALQLRVRSEFLDRITTSGAELLVGSSRMASELQLQRQSVNDLSDNLTRLRAQLRELEIHAESRIASGFSSSNAAEFDPLEFDRYTRLHELTRMMSESIADISSLQRTLSRQLDSTALAVTAQGRHARVLQSDLRWVRTLPFTSLVGRLQHLLRQAAREKGCDVVMDVEGGNLEVDRSVLDRITGPLEHLVRNAVAHGIESASERLSLGKPATGRVRMDLSQQGNTLQLQISDDGRGLDYVRIREQAIAAGLLPPGAPADQTALADMIFEPGFSTASKVTELSGRGIGMDVVRTAVIALGGHLKVQSEQGAGTRFIFSLPLTLATMQVVLVTAGTRDVALPASLVQQMLQLSPSELTQARAAGELEWQGRRVPLYKLTTLLSDRLSAQPGATRTPVAVLRQLDQYLAIELDAVLGHREVVVKNLGPQLAKVPGIAGATVLGDGSITLIINPLPLPDFVAARTDHNEEMISADTYNHHAPRILVVDDSLTVRRASQRLLERHGYVVELARDGMDALEQLRLNTPAAVLLDIEMPRMDGFELLAALRDDARWHALPVAMITSRTAERHREHAMKLGATAYLGKPFVEEELLGLLTQWLAVPTIEGQLPLVRDSVD